MDSSWALFPIQAGILTNKMKKFYSSTATLVRVRNVRNHLTKSFFVSLLIPYATEFLGPVFVIITTAKSLL